MQEKIIVTPSEVRGLGNIVIPKSSTDYAKYKSSMTVDTEEVDGIERTVYTLDYDGRTLSVTVSKNLIAAGSDIIVTVTFKDANGNPIQNAEIDLYKEI